MHHVPKRDLPVAVFDSGVGGAEVLRFLREICAYGTAVRTARSQS